MPTPNTDPSRLTNRVVFDKDHNPIAYFDVYLQNTYRKPSPPEHKTENPHTDTRTRTITGAGGEYVPRRECQDYVDTYDADQLWGTYWVVEYTVEKETSGWTYFWAGVAVVGAIALIATGVGALAGAGLIVTTVTAAGVTTTALTTTGTLALAFGGAALSLGATIATALPSGYKKGVQVSAGAFVDEPIEKTPRRFNEQKNTVVRPWYPC